MIVEAPFAVVARALVKVWWSMRTVVVVSWLCLHNWLVG